MCFSILLWATWNSFSINFVTPYLIICHDWKNTVVKKKMRLYFKKNLGGTKALHSFPNDIQHYALLFNSRPNSMSICGIIHNTYLWNFLYPIQYMVSQVVHPKASEQWASILHPFCFSFVDSYSKLRSGYKMEAKMAWSLLSSANKNIWKVLSPIGNLPSICTVRCPCNTVNIFNMYIPPDSSNESC